MSFGRRFDELVHVHAAVESLHDTEIEVGVPSQASANKAACALSISRFGRFSLRTLFGFIRGMLKQCSWAGKLSAIDWRSMLALMEHEAAPSL